MGTVLVMRTASYFLSMADDNSNGKENIRSDKQEMTGLNNSQFYWHI